MTQSDLLDLLDHNQWVNKRILDCAMQISHQQLMAKGNFDHESAFQTLRHTLDTEWSWRLMAQKLPATQMLWDMEDLSTVEKVKQFWLSEAATLRTYVCQMDEETLNAVVEFGTAQGRPPAQAKRWQIMAHIANHSAMHRAELARYFTECGCSPGDINLLDYLLDHCKS